MPGVSYPTRQPLGARTSSEDNAGMPPPPPQLLKKRPSSGAASSGAPAPKQQVTAPKLQPLLPEEEDRPLWAFNGHPKFSLQTDKFPLVGDSKLLDSKQAISRAGAAGRTAADEWRVRALKGSQAEISRLEGALSLEEIAVQLQLGTPDELKFAAFKVRLLKSEIADEVIVRDLRQKEFDAKNRSSIAARCKSCKKQWTEHNNATCTNRHVGSFCSECDTPWTEHNNAECSNRHQGSFCSECDTLWTEHNNATCTNRNRNSICSECDTPWTEHNDVECSKRPPTSLESRLANGPDMLSNAVGKVVAICGKGHTDANHGLAAHGYPAGCFLVKEKSNAKRVCSRHKSASGGPSTTPAALFAGVKGPCTVRGCTRCDDAPAA